MTKEAALRKFFSGFGLRAYPSTAVPDEAELPYLSYTVATDNYYGESVSLTVQIWDYTTQESPLNAKVREISKAISPGGINLFCDGGYIKLTRGSPWCNNSIGEGDNKVKMRQLNVEAKFYTND